MNIGLVNKLLELFKQKHKLMEQILLLSRQMVALDLEFDQLEKHLTARQEYINKVDQLDLQIKLLKDKLVAETGLDSWEDFKKQYPDVMREFEPIVTSIKKAAIEAKNLTDESRANAEKKLNKLQLDMKKMQSSKTGMAAYHNKPKQHSGYFLDKKK